MTSQRRVRVAVVAALVVAIMGLPNAGQAHPKLIDKHWKEEGKDFRVEFLEGKHEGDKWEGEWKGKFHTKHEGGRYVLHMENEHKGKLKMFHNGKEIAEGTVHFEGKHEMKFDGHTYHQVP